ncbi:MAG TPA: hypothetical protein VKB12_22030 [Pyrinomonadaceae bacterium]|nr:hypothetical protein [Pyrinomonadaceae bacterium]
MPPCLRGRNTRSRFCYGLPIAWLTTRELMTRPVWSSVSSMMAPVVSRTRRTVWPEAFVASEPCCVSEVTFPTVRWLTTVPAVSSVRSTSHGR